MKTLTPAAAIAAALTVFAVSSALAADTMPTSSTGRFEWRAQLDFGPRAPTRAPIRIWVSDNRAMAANCDCAMMHGSGAKASDCIAMPMKGCSDSRG